MDRSIIAALAAAAIIASASPAGADPFAPPTERAPLGATAALSLKVPLGPKTAASERPSYGLSFNYGRSVGNPYLDGRPVSQALKLGDLRFDSEGLASARLASFDLRDFGRSADKDRMNIFDGPFGPIEYAIIGGAAVVVAILVL